MKKLSRFSVICVLLMGLTSCAYFQGKVIPKAKQSAADAITKAIVKTGQCTAVDMVKADVEKLLKIESNESMVVKALGSSAPEGSQQEGVVSEICKAAAKLDRARPLEDDIRDRIRHTAASSRDTERPTGVNDVHNRPALGRKDIIRVESAD